MTPNEKLQFFEALRDKVNYPSLLSDESEEGTSRLRVNATYKRVTTNLAITGSF